MLFASCAWHPSLTPVPAAPPGHADEDPLWSLRPGEIIPDASHPLPTLIYVSAPWSQDCNRVSIQTLSDPETRKFLGASFLCAHAVQGRDDALLARYEAPEAPAFIVLDRNGGWVDTFHGFRPPVFFREMLDGALNQAGESEARLEDAEQAAGSGAPWELTLLGDALLRRRLWERSLPVLEKVLASDPGEKGNLRPRAAQNLGLTLLRLGKWEEGLRALEPVHDQDPETALEIARQGIRLGYFAEARGLLAGILASRPEDRNLVAEADLLIETCRIREGDRKGAAEGLLRIWSDPASPVRDRAEFLLDRLDRVQGPVGDGAWRELREGREVVNRFGCRECHRVEPEQVTDVRNSCVACHVGILATRGDPEALRRASAEDPEWFQHLSRIRHYLYAPDLSTAGARLRPEWIASFLASPHDVRPFLEESMPRLPLKDAEIRTLVRYLQRVSERQRVSPVRSAPEPLRDAAAIARGERAFTHNACARCHTFGNHPFKDGPTSAESLPAARTAPDLALVRRRLTPAMAATWIRAPGTFETAHAMPSTPVEDGEMKDLLSFLFHGETGAPAEPRRREAPRIERQVRYEEVDEIFQDTCIHCHLPDTQGGIGNAGGGWGFAPRGLDLSSYERLKRGSIGDDGTRRSVLEPVRGGPPILLDRLHRREKENARDHVLPNAVTRKRDADEPSSDPVRGMPLGLPALEPGQIALIEAWIRQGAKGPETDAPPRRSHAMAMPP